MPIERRKKVFPVEIAEILAFFIIVSSVYFIFHTKSATISRSSSSSTVVSDAMVFATQGTAPMDFLNSTLVSAELVKTLVGSFGLVLVAPFTAIVSAAVYTRCGKGVA